MNDAVVQQTRFASIYWRWWLITIVIFALLRLAIVLLFGAASNGSIPMLYGAVAWISILFLSNRDKGKLVAYLKECHQPIWARLAARPSLDNDQFNGLRLFAWLDSPERIDDPVLAAMKMELRSTYRLLFTIFCTAPILWLLLGM